MSPRLFDVGRVRIESFDKVALAGPQFGREFPVATAQMDDEPALNAGRFDDVSSLGALFRIERSRLDVVGEKLRDQRIAVCFPKLAEKSPMFDEDLPMAGVSRQIQYLCTNG